MKDPAHEAYKNAKNKREKNQIEQFYFSRSTTKSDIKERNHYAKQAKIIGLHHQGKLSGAYYEKAQDGARKLSRAAIRKA